MTVQKSSNPVVSLVQSMAEVFRKYTQRAVSMGDMYMYVRKELEAGIIDPYGNRIPGTLYGWILDIYQNENSTFAIITKEDGKLYKVEIFVDENSQISTGPWTQVAMDFTPVTRMQLSVQRTAEGVARWYAMPACTAVLNRDGEIDSRALFDSFTEYTQRNKAYPKLDFFHLGEDLLLGEADFTARDGVNYIASGTFYDTPIARAAAKSLEEHPEYWGTSISYLPTAAPEILRNSEGVEIPVFNVGINRYISICPENLAASILTSISTQPEGVDRMNEEILKSLRVLANGDENLVSGIASRLDSNNRSAETMINRANTPAPAAGLTPAAPQAQAPVAPVTTVAQTPVAQPSPVTPVQRVLSDEEIKAVLTHPSFKSRFAEVLVEVLTEEEDPNKPAAIVAPVTPAPAADVVSTEAMAILQELRTSVKEIQENRAASVQEVLDDLPRRTANRQIVRPRATHMPVDVKNRSGNVDMAAIAAATLAEMGETV